MTIGSRSIETIEGSPNFTIRTRKMEDGTYEAIAVHHTSITPEKGEDETNAIRKMSRKLHEAAIQGKLQGG